MKVTVHRLHDQLGKLSGKIFGINDEGEKRIKEFIDTHQEWRGGERFEWGRLDTEIQFKWDMTPEQLKIYIASARPEVGEHDDWDYCGAMFFGDFKLEFISANGNGTYHNLFHYGVEGYNYLEDGTPYEEEYGPEKFEDHPRRTLDGFARNIEAQVVDWLNEYTQFIGDAIKPTKPEKWYPNMGSIYVHTITRIA